MPSLRSRISIYCAAFVAVLALLLLRQQVRAQEVPGATNADSAGARQMLFLPYVVQPEPVADAAQPYDPWHSLEHLRIVPQEVDAPLAPGDQFGGSVSVHGTTAVIGASKVDGQRGAAYVFTRSTVASNRWQHTTTLSDPTLPEDSQFGIGVAVYGDMLAVGAPYIDLGRVYLYQRDRGGANNWGLLKILPTPSTALSFGQGLILTDDTLVVGAPSERKSGSGSPITGAVYVYGRNQGGTNNWGLVKRITAQLTNDFGWFGETISLDGDTLAVAAPFETINGNGYEGAVYIYGRNQGGANNWGLLRKVTINESVTGWALLGGRHAMSLRGDTLAVGASARVINNKQSQGAVYLFMRNQGGTNNWGMVGRLIDAEGQAADNFGGKLVLAGNNLFVGQINASDSSNSLHWYRRSQATATDWSRVEERTNLGGTNYGGTLAVDGDTLMVGAPLHNVNGQYQRGMVFAYRRDEGGAGAWGLVTTLTAPGCIEECGEHYYPLAAFDLINQEREKAGCPRLRLNPQLDNAAGAHSIDMATNNFFSHTNLKGQKSANRIAAAGYVASLSGENIAAGQGSPAEVVNSWMNSSGHRSNILKCEFRDAGIGLWINSQYKFYWTQVFATPGSGFNLVPPEAEVSGPLNMSAPYSVTLDLLNVGENQPIGAGVGTLATSDIDLPDDSHTYALVENASFPDNAAFTIVGDQLQSAIRFDFERKSSYTVRIQTTDAEGNSFSRTFTVNVDDVTQLNYLPLLPRQR